MTPRIARRWCNSSTRRRENVEPAHVAAHAGRTPGFGSTVLTSSVIGLRLHGGRRTARRSALIPCAAGAFDLVCEGCSHVHLRTEAVVKYLRAGSGPVIARQPQNPASCCRSRRPGASNFSRKPKKNSAAGNAPDRETSRSPAGNKAPAASRTQMRCSGSWRSRFAVAGAGVHWKWLQRRRVRFATPAPSNDQAGCRMTKVSHREQSVHLPVTSAGTRPLAGALKLAAEETSNAIFIFGGVRRDG